MKNIQIQVEADKTNFASKNKLRSNSQDYTKTQMKLPLEEKSVQVRSVGNISSRFFAPITHSQPSNNDKNKSYRCLIM